MAGRHARSLARSSTSKTAMRSSFWFGPPRNGHTLLVFVTLLIADLVVVGFAGTDIPFHDQWDSEGSWLYPRFLTGDLQFAELLRAHNEHRILWTHLLNL